MATAIARIDRQKTGFWIILITLAVLIRIAAGLLYHTDIKGHYFESLFLRDGVARGYEEGFKNNTPLHYPPPIYLIYTVHQNLDHWAFSPAFSAWLTNGSATALRDNPYIFRDLLAMKLPVILADFFAALLLYFLVPVKRRRETVFIWLFNPLTLYLISGIGQFDIIAVDFILLSTILFKRQRFNLSYFFLGLAAGFKVFPAILLPFWLVLDPRPFSKKLEDLILFIMILLACLAPITTSPVALQSVFLSNLTGGMFKAAIDIGAGNKLSIYFVLYALLLIGLIKKSAKDVPLEGFIFAAFSLLLGLSNFHPQWIIWFVPFLLILIMQEKVGWKESLGLLCSFWLISLLLDDIFVSFGLLSAVNESFNTLPTLHSLLTRVSLASQTESAVLALNFALIIWVILEIFGKAHFQSLPPLKLSFLAKLTGAWIATAFMIFILIHIPLAVFGQYIDSDSSAADRTVTLAKNAVITQKIPVYNNNFSSLEVRLKNVNLQNKSNTDFKLTDSTGTIIFEQAINGASIGDNFNLKLKFPAQALSGGKNYLLKISNPESSTYPLQIPYQGMQKEAGLSINNKPVMGHLSYLTFYKAGSFMDSLKISLHNILTKL